MESAACILYCNCTYARVVPGEVKAAVLKGLCETGAGFEAVADLCELAARRDPALRRFAEGGALKVAACYPRAVKWLFAAAGAPLDPARTEVFNMRVETAAVVLEGIARPEVQPNMPRESGQRIDGDGANLPVVSG